jgi:hypothetical protein
MYVCIYMGIFLGREVKARCIPAVLHNPMGGTKWHIIL